jgi:IQ calmodulin-binding motif
LFFQVRGKRNETKKKSNIFGQNTFEDALPRVDPKPDPDNDTDVVMLNRPPPLNSWGSVTEKPKLSSRAVSPAVAAAWSPTEGKGLLGKNLSSSRSKPSSFLFDKLSVTGTTDGVLGRGSMMMDGHAAGSNGSNDDGTTVSGVTNPSYFHDEKTTKKRLKVKTTAVSSTGTDPFDVNSPIFSSGDPFFRAGPSPKNQFTTEPVLSGDFSDPFFPGGTEDVTKEESGVSEAPDPYLDHVGMLDGDSDEDENGVNPPVTHIVQLRHNHWPPQNTSVDLSAARRAAKSAIDKVLESSVSASKSESARRALSKTEPTPKATMSSKSGSAAGSKLTLRSNSPVRVFAKAEPAPRSNISDGKKIAPVTEGNNAITFLSATASSTAKVISHVGPNTSMTAGMARKIRERQMKKGEQKPPTIEEVSAKVSSRAVDNARDKIPTQSAATRVLGKGVSPYRAARLPKLSSAPKTKAGPPPNPVPPPAIKRISHVKQAAKPAAAKGYAAKSSMPAKTNRSIDGRHDDFTVSSEDSSHPIQRQSTGELSISSVGSDIQRLRSILHRSRLHDNLEKVRYIEPLESAFAVYDEKQIKDPMQRAGLRLLSAAVIPIQAVARRHLAFRAALTRMWAIVVIQAIARRWFERSHYNRQREAAVKIQALYRGGSMRDHELLEHCCAIEIQRHVRGLIASLHVYDDIYKITLAQACVRRKQAMNYAMDRMVAIIEMQSLFRGCLLRMRRDRLAKAVTCVQTAWRAFSGRFNYQLDLLDVIIVQSVWRRKSARILYKGMVHDHRVRCAVKIQSQWRSYDCTMNYLHYLADVLITQSAARRWMARNRCHAIRVDHVVVLQAAVRCFLAKLCLQRIRSAILIQSVWRGFVCYADYMFTISDILLVQSIARCWLKKKEYPEMLQEHKSIAAVTIQKHWRGFSQATDYFVMLYEKRAATTIQTCWRRFLHFSKFVIVIDSVIRIQSTCRGHIDRQTMVRKIFAATVIQCAYRITLAKKHTEIFSAARRLFIDSQKIAVQQDGCATDIQRVVRGYQVRDAVALYTKTRTIQAAWRRCVARAEFARHLKARSIQNVWRGYLARDEFVSHLQARTIQTAWRRFTVCTAFHIYLNARSIQAAWRGHIVRKDVAEYWKIRKIQALWRGCAVRAKLTFYLKAQTIQAAWRGCMIRLPFKEYIAARRIQTLWRRRTARRALRNYVEERRVTNRRFASACRIQTFWRCKILFSAYKEYVAVRRIQAVWRGKSICRAYRQFIAACRIQAVWRGKLVYCGYRQFVAARRIQAVVKGKSICRGFRQFVGARRIQAVWRGKTLHMAFKRFIAARRIQAVWRGKTLCIAYKHFIAARRIQAVWRGKLICRAYREFISARRIQTFWRCRTVCNAYNMYRNTRSFRYDQFYSACRIQALWRCKSLQRAFQQYLAARRIQTFWRCKNLWNVYKLYSGTRSVWYDTFTSARRIQAFWRCQSLRTAYTQYIATRRIQAFWRCKSIQTAYTHYVAARRIQTFWRCSSLRVAFTKYMVAYRSARCIQTFWRLKSLQQNSKGSLGKKPHQYVHAVTILQQVARGHLVRRSDKICAMKEMRERTLAATVIEKTWRGFCSRQQYWHVLGSTIEIQAVVRGWIAQRRLRRLRERAVIQIRSAIKIKNFVLDYLAKRRLYEATVAKSKEVDRAAITIQRFFLMVKAEVDREIRAEKRRRKARKKQKKRKDVLDDKVLESVWRKTMEEDVLGSENLRRASGAAAYALATKPRRSSSDVESKVNEESTVKKSIGLGLNSIRTVTGQILGVLQLTRTSVRLDDDDNMKAIPQPSMQRQAPPKSRLATLSQSEMEDDLNLEEAWIDSKILNAKQRRRAEKRSSKRSGHRNPSLPTKPTHVSSDRRPPRRAQEV